MQNVPSPKDLFMIFVTTGVHVDNIYLRMVVGMGSGSECFNFIPMTIADTSVCIIGANLDSSGIEYLKGQISPKRSLIFSIFIENSLQIEIKMKKK